MQQFYFVMHIVEFLNSLRFQNAGRLFKNLGFCCLLFSIIQENTFFYRSYAALLKEESRIYSSRISYFIKMFVELYILYVEQIFGGSLSMLSS